MIVADCMIAAWVGVPCALRYLGSSPRLIG
jgi:hypothetical protein